MSMGTAFCFAEASTLSLYSDEVEAMWPCPVPLGPSGPSCRCSCNLGEATLVGDAVVCDLVFRLKSSVCLGLAFVNEKPVAGSSSEDIGRVRRLTFVGRWWLDCSGPFELVLSSTIF